MLKFIPATVCAAIALAAGPAWSQAEKSRAQVKAETAQAAKKGDIGTSSEVDEREPAASGAKAKKRASSMKKAASAPGAASSGK